MAQIVQPSDIVAGLGAADRKLLSACLALFEDSTLSRRVEQLYEHASDKIRSGLGREETKQATEDVRTTLQKWVDSAHSDEDLRLVLWMHLREAFGLPEQLCLSLRAASSVADDLVAAAINFVDPPPGLWDKGKALIGIPVDTERTVTLAEVVSPVVNEMLSRALEDGEAGINAAARDQLIAEARNRLEQMDAETQSSLLAAVGADKLNDEAIAKILLTGGGLTAFSTGVGIAGFSAYILAAQASAFIPLVSGPALVSVVAVVSNPLTVIAATGAALWWFAKSTSDYVKASIGVRVIALLALQGLNAGRKGLPHALASFRRSPNLSIIGNLNRDVLTRYRKEWKMLEAVLGRVGRSPDAMIDGLMMRPAIVEGKERSSFERLLFPGEGGLKDTAAVSALTIGDILYSAAAINPAVIEAANFARTQEIGDRLDFAAFAYEVQQLDPLSEIGAESNLKGYVAERLVAAQLVERGHQVSFPDSSNQEGWDLLVDGQKFQVKTLSDASGLSHHFSEFPDIPVLANSELTEFVPEQWADNVYFVEGFSNESVTELTQSSLDAGANMLNPHVPIFALCVSAIRNLKSFRERRVTGAQAVEQVILDGSIRAGLAAAGGFVGPGIGLLVFGPAGALVLGATVPVLSQAQSSRVKGVLDRSITSPEYKAWAAHTDQAINVLIGVLEGAVSIKIDLLRTKYAATQPSPLGDYVRFRFEDEARYQRETLARLRNVGAVASESVEARALAVIRWAATSTVHPATFQAPIKELNNLLQLRPLLTHRLREHVAEAIQDTAKATKRAAKRMQEWWAGKTR